MNRIPPLRFSHVAAGCVLLAAASMSPATSAPITVDFEDASTGMPLSAYTSQGVSFSVAGGSGSIFVGPVEFVGPFTKLAQFRPTVPGATFGFTFTEPVADLSFQFALPALAVVGDDPVMRINCYAADGALVVSGPIFDNAPSDQYGSFTSAFTNAPVKRVEVRDFYPGYLGVPIRFDNLVFSPVPTPPPGDPPGSTRWLPGVFDGVQGAWFDPTRWSNGVPGPGTPVIIPGRRDAQGVWLDVANIVSGDAHAKSIDIIGSGVVQHQVGQSTMTVERDLSIHGNRFEAIYNLFAAAGSSASLLLKGNLYIGGTSAGPEGFGDFRVTNCTATVLGAVTVYPGGTVTLYGGGKIVSGQLTFPSASTLGGSGRVTGNVSAAGYVSPGNSPGILTVEGNLTLQQGSVVTMELAGLAAEACDRLVVTGQVQNQGSELVVVLLGGFQPGPGAKFDLIDAGTTSGTFSQITLPTLRPDLYWVTEDLYATGTLYVTLSGDATLDGVVDAADVARLAAGGDRWTTGDFNGDGKLSADDWALLNLGAAIAGRYAATEVPEPATSLLPALALTAGAARRVRRR